MCVCVSLAMLSVSRRLINALGSTRLEARWPRTATSRRHLVGRDRGRETSNPSVENVPSFVCPSFPKLKRRTPTLLKSGAQTVSSFADGRRRMRPVQGQAVSTAARGSLRPLSRRLLESWQTCDRFTGWLVLVQLGLTIVGLMLATLLFFHDSGADHIGAGSPDCFARWGLWMSPPALFWGGIAGASTPAAPARLCRAAPLLLPRDAAPRALDRLDRSGPSRSPPPPPPPPPPAQPVSHKGKDWVGLGLTILDSLDVRPPPCRTRSQTPLPLLLTTPTSRAAGALDGKPDQRVCARGGVGAPMPHHHRPLRATLRTASRDAPRCAEMSRDSVAAGARLAQLRAPEADLGLRDDHPLLGWDAGRV